MKHFTTKITTTKLSLGIMLTTASLFIACGDSKVSGTDEQTNSVNATINEWLEGDTLKVAPDEPLGDLTTYPTIKTEHGKISHPVKNNFESMFCETEDNFFTYNITVSDTLIQKNFGIPDTISAKDFEKDCTLEGGVFTEQKSAFEGKRSYQCDLKISDGEDLLYIDPNWKKHAQQIIDICGEPIEDDSTEKEDLLSPDIEENLQSYLKGNPISNMIQVDHWCPELSYECPGVSLSKGVVATSYWGSFEFISCEDYKTDSLDEVQKIRSYKVQLDGNRITKTWHNDDFAQMSTDEITLAKTGFTEHCGTEKGSIVTDTDSEISCQIKIAPVNKEDIEANGAEPFYNYNDPVWDIYGTKVIAACR